MKNKAIVYGIGNPNRGDDGIGYYCVNRIKRCNIPKGWICECKKIYQLTIDVLEEASLYENIFIFDATFNSDINDFAFIKINSGLSANFTTHILSPEEFLLSLEKMFKKNFNLFTIAVRGYNWDLSPQLSPLALKNAQKAIEYFIYYLTNNNLS